MKDKISVSYAVDWVLKFAPEYKFTSDGKCFNFKSGKQIRQRYKSRSIGYYIRGKFRSLSSLRPQLQRIELNDCPF